MGNNPLKFLILFSFVLPLPTNQQLPDADISNADRLPPSAFPNLLQYQAYLVIQRFKRTVTCDPNNVTATWVGSHPCEYRGFLCATPPNLNNTPTIASVDFNSYRLCAPTLSDFLDRLPDLAIFHANSNSFSGTVPDLTSLPFLHELDLSNNRLSGRFPSALLPLDRLIFLDIRYNCFSGTVPTGIFLLGLDVLFLNDNQFSQPLPESIGESSVAYLTLANNGFTGSIPSSIGNSSDTLTEVLFLNNQLSGCLPQEAGLLERATVFDAGFNRLTGPIPWSFGCLKKVEQLNLAGNLLYGHVPEVVCRLAKVGNLANMSLSGNYFTAVGGILCWELIESGVLDLSGNCVAGLPNQRSAWECLHFLSKAEYCPLLVFMPCVLGEADRDALPSSSSSSEEKGKGKGKGKGSVTYNAVRNPHGK